MLAYVYLIKIFKKTRLEKFSLEDEIIYKLIKNRKIYGLKKNFFLWYWYFKRFPKSAKKLLFKNIKNEVFFR